MSPETLSVVPPVIGAPLFALLFFLVAAALGSRIMLWLRVPIAQLSGGEHAVLATTLGMGSLQLVPWTLAMAGVMTPMNVRAACAVVVVLLSRDLLRVCRSGLRACQRLVTLRPTKPQLVWSLLLCVVFAGLLLRALVFRAFGDDDGYHLTGPKRWLASGVLHYLPTYTHTNASLGFEMLYVIALSVHDVIGAKLLHFGAGLLALAGVYLVAKRLGNALAGMLTISLVLIVSPVLNLPVLFTVAYSDFGALSMAMASILLWLLWLELRAEGFFIAMALCAGLAGSFKFTSLAIGIAWAPALVYVARKAGSTWPGALLRVVGFGLISALPVVPWLIRNASETGNPLYPLGSSIIPTRDWSAAHAEVFGRYVHYYSWGVAHGSQLSETARKGIVLGTVVMLCVASALTLKLVRRVELRAMLGFSAAFVGISVLLTGMIFRYWLPAVLCATLALLVSATQRWSSASWRYWPLSGLLVVALLRMEGDPDQTFTGNVKLASGLSDFATVNPDDHGWRMWKFINHQTPPDARILAAAFYTTLGSSSFGGFWADRTFYTTDPHLQTFIRLDDWSEFVTSVERARISHVLIFEQQGKGSRHGFSFPAGTNEYPFCRRLVDSYGEKVAQFKDFQLYRVFPERAAAEANKQAVGPGP